MKRSTLPRLCAARILAAQIGVGALVTMALAPPRSANAAPASAATADALHTELRTIVVIYAENRAFDNLYGNFPGADGISQVVGADGKPLAAYRPQLDRDGSTLPTLPPTWGGVTAPGVAPAVSEAQSGGLPNAPFSIEHAFTPASGVTLTSRVVTRDLYHRFFEHQMQIDGGSNAGFAAWSDAGGLTMGHYDTAQSALANLARRYVLADHFFQGAFGGSFLNHQYLICACAPVYPHADSAPAHPPITALETDGDGRPLPRLRVAPGSPASALGGPPVFVQSSNIAPAGFFGDGMFHAINTMQPPFQPSGNPPAAAVAADPSAAPGVAAPGAAAAAVLAYADPNRPTTLPPQSGPTIGDRLTVRGVSFAWYAGAWRAALADGERPAAEPRKAIYTPETPAGSPDFQPHHQPFNYYARFDPKAHPDERRRHLKDYEDLLADNAAGRLPQVVFYKPQGNLNEHPGYASIADGDAHISQLIEKLQAGRQWGHMVIIVTYDEYGGAWDHVPPPKGDLLGPGTRIPALVISPFAKRGVVDHTPYDTASILRLITRRFDLKPLPGVVARDRALAEHGEPPMGDLTQALDLRR